MCIRDSLTAIDFDNIVSSRSLYEQMIQAQNQRDLSVTQKCVRKAEINLRKFNKITFSREQNHFHVCYKMCIIVMFQRYF